MRRRHLAPLGIAACLLTAVAAPALAADAPAPPADGTLGLVLSSRYHAVYETPNGQECPDGLQHTMLEQYRAAYPTEAARKAHDQKFGYYANLGPNGENVFFNPTLFKDPLPFKELKSTVALGVDLDGRSDPDDFTSPDGRPGVDNQLYRVVGCISGFRTKGAVKETADNFIRVSLYNRLLLQVTGVDSMVDDPEVQVAVWRGQDPLALDATNRALPWRTQRVDLKTSDRFQARLKGRIVGGYLVTDPADVVLPAGIQAQVASEHHYGAMRLRLKLTDTTAEGVMAGYDDLEKWYRTQVKYWGAGAIAEFNKFSPPTLWAALQRYADANPDPATGQNRAISSAYAVRFVRTVIVFPDPPAADEVARPLASPDNPERVAAEPAPAAVKLQYSDYGFVYATADGRTLYTWAADTPGKSKCGDTRVVEIKDGIGTPAMLPEYELRRTCQQVWPPATAPAGFVPVGKWASLLRADGSTQLTYGGQALYTSVLDAQPGEINGWGPYGIGNASGRAPLWAKVEAPPQVQVVVTPAGRTLATAGGMSLYVYGAGGDKAAACRQECLAAWRPFAAGELAEPFGDWSVVARDDASRQWAYRGRPLYTHVGDERQADINGNGVGKWRAAVLQAPPAAPAGVNVAVTTGGEVLTDSQGRTLYRFLCAEYSPDRLNCDGPDSTQAYRLSICGGPEKCGRTWRYLPADGAARPPNRLWKVVSVDPVSGVFCTNRAQTCTQKAWAYMGRPVYTFAGDRRPGDIEGDQVRVFPFGFVRLRPDGKVEP